MPFRRFVPLLVIASICLPAVLRAEPSLSERVRAANVWQRLGRHGSLQYLMLTQPTPLEAARARELGVPATSFDTAQAVLGRPIAFTAADATGGASEFGAGIRGRRVENNALKFDVGDKDAYIAWGDFDGKHPEYGVKPFGVAYQWLRNGREYASTFASGEPFGIYLRVRQSFKESTWRIVTHPNPDLADVKPKSPPGGYLAEFKVMGTEWQTIPVIYSDKVKGPDGKPAYTLLPFGGFAVHFGDPGNQVEMEWIRITDPANHVYARRTLNLTAPAVEARMTLSSWDGEVYVDGQRVADRWVTFASMGAREIDLTPHLAQAGRHVVAVHALNGYGELMATGGVHCRDGSYAPLFSWLPLKLESNKWVLDPAIEHFSLHSPLAGPWKTATLAFSPEDASRFAQPDYDDSTWSELTALHSSGTMPIGPPYFGLIAVDLPFPEKQVWRGDDPKTPRKHPIFSVREPVRLNIAALQTSPDQPRCSMPFELVDKQAGTTLEKGDLPLDKDRRHLFLRQGLSAGAYELRLSLNADGKILDERPYEFLVVGPIDQPVVDDDDVLAGLKLKTVVDIDCTATPPAGEYGAFRGWAGKGAPYEAKVVEASFGSFRETGPDNADSFSYKVRIPNPRRPHILEVTYPDDKFRVHGFFYTEPRSSDGLSIGTNRCSVAVISGWPGKPANAFQVTRGLFWPVDPVGTVDVYTTRYSLEHPAANAAAARIRIHEIEGEVPRFQARDFPGQFKPIGVHTERGGYVMWPTYYSGRNNAGEAALYTSHERPDFYADWFSVTGNFTRALRFHGTNFYVAGQHMYGGTNFPSRFNDNDNGTGGSIIQSQKDWGGILASVLGENDCGFVSSFEYINNSTIIGRGVPSDRQLARGVPTLLAVSHTGKTLPYTAGITAHTPLPSWVHPEVQQMYLAEIDELIELYKEYPGWKGISLLVHTLCGPSYGEVGEDPLKLGYEDVAAERFEKETGLKIPVAANDPARFSRRYAWVTGDPKNRDAWVQWRCDVLLALNRQVRDRLQRVRPDCTLYLDVAYPYRTSNDEKLIEARDPETLRKHIMQWGWDVAAYQKEPGMVVSTMVTGNLEKVVVMSGKPENAPRQRALALEPNYLRLFSGGGRGGFHLYHIFTENWPLAEPGKWLWSANGAWVGYHWPTGDAYNDYWTNTLARVHPSLLVFNWHDSNLDSRMEPGLRRFTRAWRPLPNGRYEPLAGNGLDANIVVQRSADKPEYHYLANPCSWSAVTTLTFPAGARVTDLNRGQPVTLAADGTWKMELPPYALHSFRVEAGLLLKAATAIDAASTAKLAGRVNEEQVLAQTKSDPPFTQQVAELKRALDRGDYRAVEDTLRGGYEYHEARKKITAVKKP